MKPRGGKVIRYRKFHLLQRWRRTRTVLLYRDFKGIKGRKEEFLY